MAALARPTEARILEGVVARVHRPGDPLNYKEGPEFRDASELAIIAKNLPGTVLTLMHPDKMLAEGGVARIVGRVLDARLDGDTVVGRVLVEDDEAKAAIAGGVRELSLGYYSGLDRSRHQRHTKLDHLAVIPRARCGPICRMRTDAMTAEVPHVDCADDASCACRTDEIGGMRELVREGEDLRDAIPVPMSAGDDPHQEPSVNLEQALAALNVANEKIGAVTARADQAERELAATTARATAAEKASAEHEAEATRAKKDADDLRAAAEARAKRDAEDAVKAEADAVKAKKDAKDAEDARVATRVGVLTNANAILGAVDATGKAIDRSEMSDEAIKIAIVKHVDALDIPTGKHPAYVDALYDSAVGRHATGASSVAATRAAIVTQHRDGTPPTAPKNPERAADQVNRDNISSAWQQVPAKKGQ